MNAEEPKKKSQVVKRPGACDFKEITGKDVAPNDSHGALKKASLIPPSCRTSRMNGMKYKLAQSANIR